MIAPKTAPLPGTRPEGARDEREAAAQVRDMFGQIAPRYDLLNHLLSLSLDRVWRWRTAKRFTHILGRPEARAIDVCCGTGDLAFALARERKRALQAIGASGASSAAPVIGSDFVEPMLERARDKARTAGHRAEFAAADALRLPFADASADLLTSAFGFRNLANYEQGLREFARVLRPGGEVGILEFTEPGAGPLAGVFRFYFRRILPLVGGAISGNSQAYRYLPGSVAKFPSASELAALMERCGFRDVRVSSWNVGSVALHTAKRV
ncbi:MAG TPA: bifunctional demethylmenaquinone methyltransferase/2-methoxy-6-polyprenyl-1,4-benzoquinol methylase UbiE [Candidatus Dormibacteraeota bacterium]|nr:bifunctional demethylmenaquinone methyltransferase/2-methoxy-6-polyprenyl-1,4-benzoquinol methylase UbiE [Candidatus Dormibacteraeota bacterium]